MDGWHPDPEEAMRADGATFTNYRPPPGRFQAKTLAECRTDHAADYLIKGVLARRDLALIYGHPGAGKGLLGPLLAHATANGRRVFGRRTRASRVLFIAAEAPGDMETRFVALRERYGEAADLHLLAGPMDLHSADSTDHAGLRAYIARLKPDLILLDTLAAAFPGLQENESCDMGRAARKLRQLGTPMAEPEVAGGWTGAAVVAIHHAPKGGETPRGHGNLNADADVTMRVEGEHDQPRSVSFGKNRNGPSGHAFAFAVELVDLGTDSDGDPIRRPIAVEVEGPAQPPAGKGGPKLHPEAVSLLRHIADAINEGQGGLARPKPKMPLVPTIPKQALIPYLARNGWLQVSEQVSAGGDRSETVPKSEHTRLWKRLNALQINGSAGFSRHDVWLAKPDQTP